MMVSEARQIATKLLKEHEVEPLDKSIVKQGDEIIRSYEKQILGKR